MIDKRELMDFHRPAFRDWRWLETCWFSAFIPEKKIRMHFRAAFRTTLEVVLSTIKVYSRSGGIFDMDFADSQSYIPMNRTDRYTHFSLMNGLAVKGTPAPDAYELRYKSRDGRCSAELDFEALMAPVDTHFTKVRGSEPGFAAFDREAKGDAPVGHVDQTFRVRGKLRVDKETFEVDCVSNHDHSWSPRSEFKSKIGTFENVHFGEDLTVFLQAVEPRLHEPNVSHAYILRGAELRPVKEAKALYKRTGFITDKVRYEIVDGDGERYELDCDVAHNIGVDAGSNAWTHMHYLTSEWRGKRGYGELMWHCDIPDFQRQLRDARKSDRAADLNGVFGQRESETA